MGAPLPLNLKLGELTSLRVSPSQPAVSERNHSCQWCLRRGRQLYTCNGKLRTLNNLVTAHGHAEASNAEERDPSVQVRVVEPRIISSSIQAMIAALRGRVHNKRLVVQHIHTGLLEETSSLTAHTRIAIVQCRCPSKTSGRAGSDRSASPTVKPRTETDTFAMTEARAVRIIQDTCCPETWVVVRTQNILHSTVEKAPTHDQWLTVVTPKEEPVDSRSNQDQSRRRHIPNMTTVNETIDSATRTRTPPDKKSRLVTAGVEVKKVPSTSNTQ